MGDKQNEQSEVDSTLNNDPSHILVSRFFHEYLANMKSGTVLEIGSRARSGIDRRELIPEHMDYVGFDIIPGPNVDVVGDAHNLSKYFKKKSIDCIFSMSVLEHIAMPWKFAIEMNKVMKVGAIAMHSSHQAWPLHEIPWDYWRFSENTWKTFFNSKTGFEIVETAVGEPANLHPVYLHPAVKEVSKFPNFMQSSVICKKVSRTWLRWNVPISEVSDSPYPH